MEEERIPRKVFNGKFDKTRSVGKPRGMHYRSQEWEAEGDELGIEKN
jgi:hypothetical protein